MENVLPDVVDKSGKFLSVRYNELVPLLIEAVRELDDRTKNENGESSSTIVDTLVDKVLEKVRMLKETNNDLWTEIKALKTKADYIIMKQKI